MNKHPDCAVSCQMGEAYGCPGYSCSSACEFLEYHKPEWATGVTTDPFEIGAQLYTKDGRRCGNAVTISVQQYSTGITGQLAVVVTDFGTELFLNAAELAELFHRPAWKMDIATHPGVRRFFESKQPAFSKPITDPAVIESTFAKDCEQSGPGYEVLTVSAGSPKPPAWVGKDDES